MKKKILIHSIAFSPDGVSTAYLYNDIAKKFKDNDYDVIVLTTTPHYNVILSEIIKQPLSRKFLGLYYESNFDGIKVIHVPQKKFRSALLRIIGFAYWHVLSFFLALVQSKIDVIISPSPPLTIGLINILVGKLKGAKIIYNVQEIYPDFLINQGLLKSKLIIRILKVLERFVYNSSTAVTTIDAVFYQTIVSRFKDPSKLHIIPNFVDTKLFKPILPKDIRVNNEYFNAPNDNLKVMYAGNIGHAQDWSPLLSIAKTLANEPVEFFVIGEGVMKDWLMKEIDIKKVSNIHLIPYQNRDDMPSLIAFADLHFIFMTPEMENDGFPSKVYTIMACSKPLLILSGEGTPISNFLNPHGCAFLISEKSLGKKCEELVSAIRKCIQTPEILITMGENGFSVIESYYSKDVVTAQYFKLVDKGLNN